MFVEAIEFYAYHGASDEEQVVGHRFTVDVAVNVDTAPAAASDALCDAVDYSALAGRIVQIGGAERCRLVETLAERMASALLAEFPIAAVRLRIRKPHPPMNVIAGAAGVEIYRTAVRPL